MKTANQFYKTISITPKACPFLSFAVAFENSLDKRPPPSVIITAISNAIAAWFDLLDVDWVYKIWYEVTADESEKLFAGQVTADWQLIFEKIISRVYRENGQVDNTHLYAYIYSAFEKEYEN